MSTMKTIQTEQETALALHIALAGVDITNVPVMSNERMIPRKDQAALARKLFRSLGLKGISVTTPNYSMAQSVDVSPAKRSDYVFDAHQFVVEGDLAQKANHEASQRIESILLAAFPNHDNRSDSQSDYFDFCWSVR